MALNVLIVDDSPVMRKILARTLHQACSGSLGDIVEAADCTEAMEILNATAVQVIFSDVKGPNGEGLDLLRAVKDSPHKDLPVVMLTSEGAGKTMMQAIALGARGFIRKPFTPTQMEAVLAKITAQSRTRN